MYFFAGGCRLKIRSRKKSLRNKRRLTYAISNVVSKKTNQIWRLLFCCKKIFRWTKRKSQPPPKKIRKYLNNEFVNCLNFGTPGSKSFKNHIEPANLTKKDWERKLFRLFRPKGKGCDFVFAPIFFVERFGTLFCHEWGVLEVSEALDATVRTAKTRSTIWDWSQSFQSSTKHEKIGNTFKILQKYFKKWIVFFFKKKPKM